VTSGAEDSDRALLIVGMSTVAVDAAPPLRDAVRFIQGELRYFRERARLVLFAQSAGDTVVNELTPRTDEHVIDAAGPSAFFRTDIDTLLRARSIRRLTVVGVESHTAIAATVLDAKQLGYAVVVPEPCVAASDTDAHRAALHLMYAVWTAR
jgi:nicotinamidase-related amidase